MTNKRLRAELLQLGDSLYGVGAISKKQLRGGYYLIEPIPEYTPRKVKRLRKKLEISQITFAALLNVNVSTVQKWEQGQKKPSGLACKLLHLAEKQGIEVLVNA